MVKCNQLQYPLKKKKGMEFVDLFLFISISLFYFDIKIVLENSTSNMLTYSIILKTGDVYFWFLKNVEAQTEKLQ